MSQKAVVFKIVGDKNIGNSIENGIVRGIETREICALRTKLHILEQRDTAYWQNKIDEANRTYAIKPKNHRFPKLHEAFWFAVYVISYLAERWTSSSR